MVKEKKILTFISIAFLLSSNSALAELTLKKLIVRGLGAACFMSAGAFALKSSLAQEKTKFYDPLLRPFKKRNGADQLGRGVQDLKKGNVNEGLGEVIEGGAQVINQGLHAAGDGLQELGTNASRSLQKKNARDIKKWFLHNHKATRDNALAGAFGVVGTLFLLLS